MLNDKLKAFLKAEDLDELLALRDSLDGLSEEDFEIIRSTLQKWDNQQAVSNLLLHPTLIPEDIRLEAIFKGLNERENYYYVLASIVGLQSIDPENISDKAKSLLLDHLIYIMEVDQGVFSARSSVSILPFLKEEDATRIFKFVSHPNEATSHNILAWLLTVFEGKDIEWFAEIANASEISQETKDYAQEKLQEHIKKTEAGEFSTLILPLYSYIPNLTEISN